MSKLPGWVSALLKIVALVLLLFTLLIGLILAQPYDDAALRAFLTAPDGCPTPCFMGIRPGVTTYEEAIAILEAHEWVGTLQDNTTVNTRSASPNRNGDILWEWSGQQPRLIDADYSGRVWISQGRSAGMSIGTHITLGDIWWLLGQPDIGLVVGSDIDETYLALLANYTNIPLGVAAEWHCPVNATSFWHAPLQMVLPSFTGRDEPFTLTYPRC